MSENSRHVVKRGAKTEKCREEIREGESLYSVK